MSSLLEVKNLAVSFPAKDGKVRAVRNLSLSINRGETHCLVGESGCGKSVSSFAILNLVQKPGVIENGEILFEGEDLLKKSEAELRSIRGTDIAMIFQDPMNSLNPVYRVGDQVAESITLHKKVSKKDALKEVVELFKQVKIPDAEERIYQYPHELSGGMRQRVMIAMALACEPKLLIADEPTTALDVTIQAQILKLLKELQESRNMAILFITHDLGVVAQIAHTVTVLYAGNVVESGSAKDIFNSTAHPYTTGLLKAVPVIGDKKRRLIAIDGNVPEPSEKIKGCVFSPRCFKSEESCKTSPILESNNSSHRVVCNFPQEVL
jgi:peptide/nickel transport system ATP-binding protein